MIEEPTTIREGLVKRIHAANPTFTAEDAKAHAVEAVVGAIESYTNGDAEVAAITAVEE